MKVESELGVGSTFSFTIPIAKGATEEVDQPVFSGNQLDRFKALKHQNSGGEIVSTKSSGKSLKELLAE